MTVTPNTAGVAGAMNRLREHLGVDATFLVRGEPVWPAGTPIDPETGRPYDPFLEPEVPTEETEVTVRCSFVHRPFAPGAMGGMDMGTSPLGQADRGLAGLIVSEADYPQVQGAHRVRVGLETWDVELWRHDTSLTVGRYVCFLEHS